MPGVRTKPCWSFHNAYLSKRGFIPRSLYSTTCQPSSQLINIMFFEFSVHKRSARHKKGKGSFYIAHYPVRWTAQSALHFLPPLTDRSVHSDTNSASPGSILARQQLRAKAKSLTFPPLSIARYSFIQLSEQGHQWRERKCPIFETVTKRDSNPGSLDCESGILPLSYRAPCLRQRVPIATGYFGEEFVRLAPRMYD